MKILLLALAAATAAVSARDLTAVRPGYPRIANCYGAGLGWTAWDKGRDYWAKLDLFIGGCYDLHYDWENDRWPGVLQRTGDNIRRILEVNPHALFLPYVDVVEGPDNPRVPPAWWDLNAKGERWSGWPGYSRINTKLPEVLQFNLDRVREEILGRDCFDGVFYDCWGPDPWLVPRTAQLRDGRAIVMVNEWNFPRSGFESLNGALAEDEINRVAEGLVGFEEFLARYLRWCREGRKPCTATIVSHPSGMDNDPWRWSKLPHAERAKARDRLKDADPQMLRFGLTTTLLGDGYFAYDTSNLGRGNWWWYPEFDAPLGFPKGPAVRRADGLWQREFEGGLVLVNGSSYDVAATLPANARDFSTGRVGTRFTFPMFDGRILVPSAEPATAGDDVPLRVTREAPAELRAARLDDGTVAVQTPGGLDLRLEPSGALKSILLGGRRLCGGGWPVVARPPFVAFRVEPAGQGELQADRERAVLTCRGAFTEEGQRAVYVATVTVYPDNRFTLHFDFTAATPLDIRLWRHYFTFPVADWQGGTATAGGKSVTLPAQLGAEQILPAAAHVELTGREAAVVVDSSLPLGLVDHRKYGTEEYLLAGYPVSGQVAAGRTWAVEITVAVRASR